MIIGVVFITLSRKSNKKMDFYALFISGLIWMPIGIVFENYPLFILGAGIGFIGWLNRKKWSENRQHLKDLTPKDKKLRILMMLAIGMIMLVGLTLLMLASKGMI
jgi:hypothetical protein